MKFIVIHGHPNFDIESAVLIAEKLKRIKKDVQILTDNIIDIPSDSFVISVGGPAVNKISKQIQTLYGAAIELSQYPVTNLSIFYGTQNGFKHDNLYNLSGCICMWGEVQESTKKHTEYFLESGSILDDIINNPSRWTHQIQEVSKTSEADISEYEKYERNRPHSYKEYVLERPWPPYSD